jgi:hypothetical protein
MPFEGFEHFGVALVKLFGNYGTDWGFFAAGPTEGQSESAISGISELNGGTFWVWRG